MATRNERVVLSLDDAGFSTGMAKAAAATALLDKKLDDLDGTHVDLGKSTRQTSSDVDGLGTSLRRNERVLDSYSSRVGLIAKSIATFGPTLAPLGAVGVAGIVGFTAQVGVAAVGMASLVIAAQGVGTAIEAVNKAALEPTIKNLNAAREALDGLDPAAQTFVRRFQEFRPVLEDIRNAAAAGLFPGVTEALDSFEDAGPRVADMFQAVSASLGDLVADGAEALAGPEWAEFMDFVAREAPPALDALGRSVGNVVQGLGHLVMAFDPLNDDLSGWLLDSARGFNEWAAGLQETDGFAEFVVYVRENGPKVADALSSIADAALQIVEAAAPLGGPILEAITGIADALASLADSPLGTPIMAAVTGISALSIASTVATKSVGKLSTALAGLGATGAAGSLGASASKGGSAGLVLLGIAEQILNLQDVMEQTEAGTSGFWEGLLRSTTPGIHAIEMLGIKIPGLSESTEDADAAARKLASDIEYLKHVTGGGWDTSGLEPFYMALGYTADEARRAAQGMDDFRRSAARAMGILNQQAAMDAFHQSIDDARKTFKEFGKGLDATVNSGRQNRAALRGIAESALVAAEGLKGIERVNFLKGASDQIAKWAQKMGMGERAAERFANRVLGLNNVRGAPKVDLDDKQGRRKVMQMLRDMDLLDGTNANPAVDLLIKQFLKGKVSVEQMMRVLNGLSANPNVGADIGSAISSINAVESRLRGLDGDTAHTYVYTHFRQTGSGQGQAASPNDTPGSADGGFVPKTGLPYKDRWHYMLADGEGITTNRNGETDRSRRLIEGINAGRIDDSILSRARGFAGGGFAGARPVPRPRSTHNPNVSVAVGGAMTVVGTLQTPWGPAEVRGIARAEAADVIAQRAKFTETQR